MRYPLWIWGSGSLGAWLLLPSEIIQIITPWVCGFLLLAAAACLGLMWYEIQSHSFAEHLKKELRRVAVAITITGIAGIACWIVLPVQLSGNPSPELCATAWALCSAGFVLSLLVAHLILAFILHIEGRREGSR